MRTFAQKQNQPQEQASANLARSNTASLQRTIGNQAMQRAVQIHAENLKAGLHAPSSPRFAHDFSQIPLHAPAAGAIQTKLAINKSGDEYEQEADRISEQVMRMPGPHLQRACACGGECHKCQTEQHGHGHEHLQTKRVGAGDWGQAEVPLVHEVLRSSGQPIESATRTFMEQRFGRDFSHVRVHADEKAEDSARAVNALAYTVGRHLVFGAGQYSPTTAAGRRLLAHELAHSIQQGFASNPLPRPVGVVGEAAHGVTPNTLLPTVRNAISTAPAATTLQRQPVIAPGYSEEPLIRTRQTAHDTATSEVLSWGKDTCCSYYGFPDPEAKSRTPGTECCNKYPKFVDKKANERGLDGAASCRPDYKGRVATVTSRERPNSVVRVVCADTRAASKDILKTNTIELGFLPAAKFGKPPLKEIGEVSYGEAIEGMCYFNKKCEAYPEESTCLEPGCSKSSAAAGSTKKPDKPPK